MNPILRLPADQIRWSHVADFDLAALCTSHDPEVARLAEEEQSRRRPVSSYGGESLFQGAVQPRLANLSQDHLGL